MLGILVFAAVPASAEAARIAVTVDEPAALPPGVGAEIRDALSGRMAGLKVALVEVHLTSHAAKIRVDGKRTSVDISDWTGGGTVRVVILRVVDLATPPPPLAPLDVPPLAAPSAPLTVVAARSAPAPVGGPHGTSIVLSAAPLLLRGLSSADGVAGGAEVAATLCLDRLLIVVDGRWSYGRRNEVNHPALVTLDMLPIALVVGWGWGRLETTAGPFLGPASLWSPEQPSSVRFISGVNTAVRWRGGAGGSWSWFVAGSLDLFANRLTIEPIMTKYSTPRAAASLALGGSFGFVP